MSTDFNQNLFQPLASQPGSITINNNTSISGRITVGEQPLGNTLARLVNIEFTAGQVVSDTNLIAAAVCCGVAYH